MLRGWNQQSLMNDCSIRYKATFMAALLIAISLSQKHCALSLYTSQSLFIFTDRLSNQFQFQALHFTFYQLPLELNPKWSLPHSPFPPSSLSSSQHHPQQYPAKSKQTGKSLSSVIQTTARQAETSHSTAAAASPPVETALLAILSPWPRPITHLQNAKWFISPTWRNMPVMRIIVGNAVCFPL